MRSAARSEVDGLWRCELRAGTPAPAHPSRVRLFTVCSNSLVNSKVQM